VSKEKNEVAVFSGIHGEERRTGHYLDVLWQRVFKTRPTPEERTLEKGRNRELLGKPRKVITQWKAEELVSNVKKGTGTAANPLGGSQVGSITIMRGRE